MTTHHDPDPTPPHGTPRPSPQLVEVLQSLSMIADYANACNDYLRRGNNPKYTADTVKGLGILLDELADRVVVLLTPDTDTPSAFGGALER